jgi:hypothetical protein
VNKKGLANGDIEGVYNTDKKRDEYQMPRLDEVRQGQNGQNERQDHGQRLRGDYAAMAVVAVADVAAHPSKAEHR